MSYSPSRKLKALVVDDEPLARKNLTVMLRGDPEVEVCECASGQDAIAYLRANRPDLLFIDVQMPECDGFDVLEMTGTDLPPAIVFVTAYDQYALRAFETGALDYLLKPFDSTRFALALTRAKDKIGIAKSAPRKLERIAVKHAGGVLFLKTIEIDWIEAADYYASLHVGVRTHLLRRTLAELEQELDPAMFCRTHRSSIVNLNRVKSLNLNSQGEYEVVLEDDTHIRLSRRYRQQLQHRLNVGKINGV